MQRIKKVVTFVALPSLIVLAGCMPADVAPPPGTQTSSLSTSVAVPSNEEAVQAGEALFAQSCQRCHITGMAGAPDLTGLADRLSREQFDQTVENGRRMMPAWPQLSNTQRGQLWAFLSTATASNKRVAQTKSAGGGCGCGGGQKTQQARQEVVDDKPAEGSSCAGASTCTSGCCNTH